MYFESATTLLEAVNILLVSIGEQPVHALDSNGLGEVAAAKTKVNATSRGLQVTGLLCNTEEDYPLQRETDNTISLPKNTLYCKIKDKTDTWDTSENTRYVQRGLRVYDRVNHTYAFDEDLEAEVLITLLPFEELPSHVRELVVVRATRQFQAERLQDGNMHKFSYNDEQRALSEFNRLEGSIHDVNFLQDSHVYTIGGYKYRRMI